MPILILKGTPAMPIPGQGRTQRVSPDLLGVERGEWHVRLDTAPWVVSPVDPVELAEWSTVQAGRLTGCRRLKRTSGTKRVCTGGSLPEVVCGGTRPR